MVLKAFALAAAVLALPAVALSQQDDEQLCVNQCMFNHGPADNPAYHACVAQMCSGGQDAAPSAPSAPATGRWTNHATANGGGHSAAVEAGGRSLNYLCQRGGPGLLGLAGFGGSTRGVCLRIGGQRFSPPAIAGNGILYLQADPGSPVLAALLGGSTVEVTAGGRQVAFPLAGSGAAIRKAMSACGLRP
ncbi:hypothetical protein [uncultured Paracoccus sp.]|uniref:hypothetical protein n=1 Tax=uncultured Paracoccus sp. TaxID=189685 RepID=UPI0025D4FEF8|nr:hypothetical protein [uncultured Paracoccus sp.]